MNLTTHRLLLRELTWADLDDVHTLNSFSEVAEFNTIGIPKDRYAARGYRAQNSTDSRRVER